MSTRICLAMVLFASGLAAGCQPASVPPSPAPSPAAASSKPDIDSTAITSTPGPDPVIKLQVVDKEGFQKVLESKRGKVVVVDAWATWCAPCKTSFPHAVTLQQKYLRQGLAVVSLSMDDDDAHEEALTFLREQKADFTNLRSKLGAEELAFDEFEIDGGGLPHVKLYDRDGKLVKKFVTGDPDAVFTAEDVELAIRELITKQE